MHAQNYATDAAPGMIKREVGQAAVTATGFIGDVWDQGGDVPTNFIAVIGLENPKISAGNETYTFTLLGYNTPDRSDATVLGSSTVGASVAGIEKIAGAVGQQLVIRARTEKFAKPYRYVDLHLATGGTSPSIVFNARFSKEF